MLRGTALLSLLLLAACAPRLQQIGPPVDPPALTDKAFHTADGVDLPLRKWLPWAEPWKTAPKAVILALHGFNDYSAAFELPGHGLARRGYAVYAFDQRGFGRTPERGVWAGSDQMIADLKSATRLLHAKYPGLPLYLLGESMGAAVIMAAAVAPDAPQADGLILESPAVWGWQTQNAFNRAALDLAANTVPWMTVVPTGLRLKASDNRQALIALGRDKLVIKQTRVDAAYGLVDLMSRAYDAAPRLGSPRYLMLYGAKEAILNRGAVDKTLQTLPDLPPERGRVAVYRNGYHLLLRDWNAPAIYDDIASWIEHPDAPLPSGADRDR
ncbi:MAG TPA: alpha/beta fold hydrolase [Dongiaceae bacterium]|nr:alpha/beta fold hydrolase [Dongiaceae bacterium]